MTEFLPPVPHSRTMPPIDINAHLVRCDYLMARHPAPGFPIRAVRSDLGTWTLWLQDDCVTTIAGDLVQSTRVEATEQVTRERPGWATVLGVVGLFFFLIGIFFFFIKEDVRRPAALIEVTGTDGRTIVMKLVGVDPHAFRYAVGAT
jgi:hypothetical protein